MWTICGRASERARDGENAAVTFAPVLKLSKPELTRPVQPSSRQPAKLSDVVRPAPPIANMKDQHFFAPYAVINEIGRSRNG